MGGAVTRNRAPRLDEAAASGDNVALRSLEPYIAPSGLVRYEQLTREGEADLVHNVEAIGAWKWTRDHSQDAQLAFYINAYNLITMRMVFERRRRNPRFPGNTSLWAKLGFFTEKRQVAGQRMSLYFLENSVIRPLFSDPRIHFAINCGSWSCPRLRQTLYSAEGLQQELEDAACSFINEQGGVRVEGRNVHLSKIFKWYKADFGGAEGIVRFVKERWRGEGAFPPEGCRLRFDEYDWRLNEEPSAE